MPLKIFRDEQLKKHTIDIRTKNYHSAFSIVVTLERFGQIQTDLEDLLEVWDDDEFPWSVCIDDLEAFLLQFKRMKGTGTGKIKIAPVHSKVFDFAYQTENFGFLNEKNVELKTSGHNRPIGGY